jgi:hypothetical protein
VITETDDYVHEKTPHLHAVAQAAERQRLMVRSSPADGAEGKARPALDG